MAASHDMGTLTEELIVLITKSDRSSPGLKTLKSSVERSLKYHNFGRTNQFDVASKLAGLQEKFRVLNNDDLADALRLRLEELSSIASKWTPEILSLFLQLSDKPVTKTKLEDLNGLKPPNEPPPLTWADLDASDPLPKNDLIWKDVDFTEHSSDDNSSYVLSDSSSPSDDDVEESDTGNSPGNFREHMFTARGDERLFKSINDAQFWNVTEKFDDIDLRQTWEVNARGKRVRLTELQIVKEFIFMLQGLPTSLFRKTDGSLQMNISYSLRHSSEQVLHSLMGAFSEIAVRLDKLRTWVKTSHDAPVLQTFHQEVERHVRHFDMELSKIQTQLLTPLQDVIVSLGALFRDVLKISKPVLNIEALLPDVLNISEDRPFSVLEVLYDATSSYQLIGDEASYLQMARLFLTCFQTYIKPVRQWIQFGQVDANSDSSLILADSGNGSLHALWRSWYRLKESTEGINAPRFLQSTAKSIFTTGKSVMFLEQLGVSAENCAQCDDSKLTFDSVCNATPFPMLAPFSELFKDSLEAWFEQRSLSVSSTLRQILDQECGLWKSLDALEYVYFGKNIYVMTTVDQKIFDRIDKGRSDWNDRFLLTELFRSSFRTLDCVSPERIIVVSTSHSRQTIFKSRSVKSLADFSVEYTLPWAVCNIITKSSISQYQRIAIFLAQIRRAKYVLERYRILQQGSTPALADDYRIGYALRHRLLWFTNTLYSYLTDLVLITSTLKMRKSLSKAIDIDAMIAIHSSYMDKIEDQCLLSTKLLPIYNGIMSVLDLCVVFSQAHASHSSKEEPLKKASAPATGDLTSRRGLDMNGRIDHSPVGEDEDSSEDDEYESAVEDSHDLESNVEEVSYTDHLRQMKQQFDHQCGYVTVGLRSVARSAGRQAEWEMLAEKLDWKWYHSNVF